MHLNRKTVELSCQISKVCILTMKSYAFDFIPMNEKVRYNKCKV